MRRSRLSQLCYTYSIHFEQSHIQNRGQFDKLQDKKYKVNGKKQYGLHQSEYINNNRIRSDFSKCIEIVHIR